jgi:hypothetical protein
MGTEVTVVLRNRGNADLVDAQTGEVIVKGRPVAETQKRADRVNAIWTRRNASGGALPGVNFEIASFEASPIAGKLKVLDPPKDVEGLIVRVVCPASGPDAGYAVPEVWKNGAWSPGSSSLLAAFMTARPLSGDELYELGIPESSALEDSAEERQDLTTGQGEVAYHILAENPRQEGETDGAHWERVWPLIEEVVWPK